MFKVNGEVIVADNGKIDDFVNTKPDFKEKSDWLIEVQA